MILKFHVKQDNVWTPVYTSVFTVPLEFLISNNSFSMLSIKAFLHLLRHSKNISFLFLFNSLSPLSSSTDFMGVNPDSSCKICCSKSSLSLGSSSSLSSFPGTLCSFSSKLTLSEYHDFTRVGYLIWLRDSGVLGW